MLVTKNRLNQPKVYKTGYNSAEVIKTPAVNLGNGGCQFNNNKG